MRIDPQLKEILLRYQGKGPLYLFAWIRSIHAAYQQIESFVPLRGTIIDVGCGYGFFSNYLAAKSKERDVVGLEINPRKLAQCYRGFENAVFADKKLESLEDDSADAVIFYHVLHHLDSYEEQILLLRKSLGILKCTGVLIIIEVAERPLWKFICAWLVDHILYLGDRIFYRSRINMLRLLRDEFHLSMEDFNCDHWAPFPHVAYICRKPIVGAEI